MMGPRTHRLTLSIFFAASLFTSGLFTSAAHAQRPAPATSPGCGVLKGVTTCNEPAFRRLLTSARVISVENEPMDRSTGRQLSELATRLDKAIASPDQPGDLTFVIAPAEQHGVNIGPAEQPILKLQIYSGPNSSGDLLWVETLRGDSERPWPSSVHDVIQQFEDRLAKH